MGASSGSDPALGRLANIITRLARGDGDDIWLAEALTSWRNGNALDAALGLSATWRSQYQRQRQKHALAALAGYFPDACGRELARRITAAERRYRAAWPRDKAAGRRPDGLNGAVYDVLVLGEFPSEEKLRKFKGVSG